MAFLLPLAGAYLGYNALSFTLAGLGATKAGIVAGSYLAAT